MINYFNDGKDNMYPFSLSRESVDMFYGTMTNRMRVAGFCMTKDHNPETMDVEINGAFRGFAALEKIFALQPGQALYDASGRMVASFGEEKERVDTEESLLFEYAFQMMMDNGTFIKEDAAFLGFEENKVTDLGAARIEEHVHFDTSGGPVIIDKGAVINAFSRIEGPAYIGRDVQILSAKVRENCSFFDKVRIGGEVEDSIFYPFSNKCHEGFVGHSIFGSFVNLGALTTTSDLKNTYGGIAIQLNGKLIDTGSNKIGTFCGDHSKTGIGTLINSGTVIGFSANLFGGGFFKKEYTSYYWGRADRGTIYKLEKAMGTAKAVMPRRGLEFTKEDEELFTSIWNEENRG